MLFVIFLLSHFFPLFFLPQAKKKFFYSTDGYDPDTLTHTQVT